MAAVASRLGIAPATLRTWDRRYGLGPSAHVPGAHRRYDERDLHRLGLMRRLVLEGVSPAEAAKTALASDTDSTGADLQFPDRLGHLPTHPGGRVLALPGAEDLVRGLGRAAMALDGDAVHKGVADQLAEHGVVATWDAVIVPLLVAVGLRWARTGEGVEVEHLVSESISLALRGAVPFPAATPRTVLLASAPDDLHTLPLYAVAAGLAESGVCSRVLGAAVPAEALQAAVRRTTPAAVLLWSQTATTGDVSVLTSLPTLRPATAVVVGGPGWPDALPSHVTRADTLGAALDLLGQARSGQALASSG